MELTLIWILTTLFSTSAYESRKYMIGGLFPVHRRGPSEAEPCGPILLEKGIQRLEAMLYAIDEINNHIDGWNFTLDAIILDTCSSDSYALEQSLQFLQTTCGSSASTGRVTSIIGASNSVVSESVANIFRLFKIPQVSYASTSEELDNWHKYPYFFRVVPSDRFQVRAILDLLSYFDWTYVSAVASKGDYGESAIKSLQEQVANWTVKDICFAEVLLLPRNASDQDYDQAVKSLLLHERAKVVIVFLDEDKVGRLLAATQKRGAPKNSFLWLGSDGWGTKKSPIQNNEEFAEGAITLLPKIYKTEAGFKEYFLSLKPETQQLRNPWFKEFWENQFNCTFDILNNNLKSCTGTENLTIYYRQEDYVPMVIDSVYLIAYSIQSLCQESPDLCKFSDDKETAFRKRLKQQIQKANFNSSQGHGMVVQFDSDRSVPTYYNIYQYQRTLEGKYEYREIGEWRRGNRPKLRIYENLSWQGKDPLPHSKCSEECARGEERIAERNPRRRCCWSCKPCNDDEYLPDVMGQCTLCPSGYISTKHHTSCKEVELDYIGRDLLSPWALVPFLFALLGLMSTFVVFLVFILYRKTPLIMAAGRELCYVILLGIALCYCFTFVVILKPTEVTCGVLRTVMGLGLAVCYSALFTKTNRISRIFNRSIRIVKRLSYISPESQLVICSCLILIHVILTAIWLILSPPAVKHRMLIEPRIYTAGCGFDGMSVILALLYNMVLIILCTYYAYKTRNIPENFNESKYISFAMYASCIIWLAFIPIFCSSDTLQDYKVQAIVLCMSVSASGTATLACLFIPKAYIVIFHPEKNVRYPNSTPTSSTPTINVLPVRFMRSNQNSPATQRSPMGSNLDLGSVVDGVFAIDKSITNLNVEGSNESIK